MTTNISGIFIGHHGNNYGDRIHDNNAIAGVIVVKEHLIARRETAASLRTMCERCGVPHHHHKEVA